MADYSKTEIFSDVILPPAGKSQKHTDTTTGFYSVLKAALFTNKKKKEKKKGLIPNRVR